MAGWQLRSRSSGAIQAAAPTPRSTGLGNFDRPAKLRDIFKARFDLMRYTNNAYAGHNPKGIVADVDVVTSATQGVTE